jgi:hypothetical protein
MLNWDDFHAEEKPKAKTPATPVLRHKQLRKTQLHRRLQWHHFNPSQPLLPLTEQKQLLLL